MLCTCKTRRVEILYGDLSVSCLGLSHGILTGLIMTHRTIPSELLSLKQYRSPTVYYPFYKVGECPKKKKQLPAIFHPKANKNLSKSWKIHTFGRKKIVQKHNYTQFYIYLCIYIYIYIITQLYIYTLYIFFYFSKHFLITVTTWDCVPFCMKSVW